jgi:16S rRNA (uracil1498-N3)-methyltransferase
VRMHIRFFVEKQYIQEGHFAINDQGVLHQALKVLRVQKGDQIVLLDNSGKEFHGTVIEIHKKLLAGTIEEESKNMHELKRRIILYQALPKKISLFELVLQKATELGVSQIVPLITERTERESFTKLERMHTILREAAEQSLRGRIPELGEPIHFNETIHGVPHGFVFDPNAEESFVHQTKDMQEEVHLFVGPEGGFTDKEISEAVGAGLIISRIGDSVLRTETAGIVATALAALSD